MSFAYSTGLIFGIFDIAGTTALLGVELEGALADADRFTSDVSC